MTPPDLARELRRTFYSLSRSTDDAAWLAVANRAAELTRGTMTREEVVCDLNAWEWPSDISAFTEAEQRDITHAVFAVVSKLVP
jgi:hypothetical protein